MNEYVGTDPIDSIRWVAASELEANPWNPNRVHKPELALLEQSILLTGWIQPVLVSREKMIIDGFHRWRLSLDSEPVRSRYGGLLPVAVLDVDRASAMLLTVRINRAKGSHGSVHMSTLVRSLLELGIPRDRIKREMGATDLELDLLSAADLFVARDSKSHAYSPSWYPVEVPQGTDPNEGDLELVPDESEVTVDDRV
jgi:hypothetical protein